MFIFKYNINHRLEEPNGPKSCGSKLKRSNSLAVVPPHGKEGKAKAQQHRGKLGEGAPVHHRVVRKAPKNQGAVSLETMSVRRQSVSSQDLDPFENTQEIDTATTNRGLSGSSSSNHHNELAQTHVIYSNGTPVAPSRAPVAGINNQSSGSVENGRQGATKTRTVADLRAARESRANEALKMKDEQLRILQEQNNQLLSNLDR